jgi:hypothetical protein
VHRVAAAAAIHPQCRRTWCWASVLEYLHAVCGGGRPGQDEVASDATGHDCTGGCGGGCVPGCDGLLALETLMRDRKLLAEVGTPDDEGWRLVPGEIQGKRPVALRAPSYGTQAHFAAISGWIRPQAGQEVYVEVMDPAGGMIRYQTLERLRQGLIGWQAPSHLYFSRKPERAVAGPGTGAAPSPGSAAVAEQGQQGPFPAVPVALAAEGRVREVRLAPPPGWESAVQEVLGFFLALGGAAPAPLRGLRAADLTVCGPFPMGRVEDTLQQVIFGLEVRPTWGFALFAGQLGLGFLELAKLAGGALRFEALSFAPGVRGQDDRYVEAIRDAFSNLGEAARGAVLFSVPHLHETAVIATESPEVWTPGVSDGQAIPLRGFSFLPDLELRPDWLDYHRLLLTAQEELAALAG